MIKEPCKWWYDLWVELHENGDRGMRWLFHGDWKWVVYALKKLYYY